MTLPRLAICCGEPAGIGIDLLLQLSQHTIAAQCIVIADAHVIQQRAEMLNHVVTIAAYDEDLARLPASPDQLIVLDIQCAEAVQPGVLNKANAHYVLETLDRATSGCLSGEFDAMVTLPLHKGVINDAGIPFSGHTEYLAGLTQSPMPVMMLAAGKFRVALATTHLPLKAVSAAITKQSLTDVLTVLHNDLLSKFGLTNPKIYICGLNPHAGEGGHLGMEEIETITPTVETLNASGMNLVGPLPADTLFTEKYLADADAVLAMFHDQGLPVLKHASFGEAINITLGLPIIRTSVDHGTALDLVGHGIADAGSFQAAVQSAIELSQAKVT
ncbi:MAG: 4-hydroxythreonine-4-phosphate dehydrogenase PdxA [Leucothrix sp.]